MSATVPSEQRRGWVWLVAALAGLLTMGLRFTPVYDPDYFWHLATGQWIARHGAIPFHDVFSHTFAGQPLQFVDALADLLMYGLWLAGGDAANIAFFTACGGLTVAAMTLVLARWRPDARWCALVPTAALLVAGLVFRNSPRPQTLTFTLFALLLGLLLVPVAEGRGRSRALAVVALIAAWQNLHASAVVGVLAVLAAVVGAGVDRARGRAAPAWLAGAPGGALLAASLGALLIAPHPVERLLAGFAHLGDPRVPAILFEWAPIWRDGFAPLQQGWAQAFVVALGLGLAAALLPAGRTLGSGVWLTSLGFAAMGAPSVRFVPVAVVALSPLVLVTLSALLERLRPQLAALMAIGLTVGSVALAVQQQRPLGTGIASADFPVGAAAFLAREQPKGKLYNDFFDGGFLLWALDGRYPVFIDGRAMALYGIGFVEQVYNPKPGTWLQLWPKYDVGVAVVYHDQRLREVQALPGWSVVYVDDRAFVAVRNDLNPELVQRLGLRELHPADTAEDVARLQAEPARLPAAQAEVARLLRDAPEASSSHLLAASVALAAGELVRAKAETVQALERKPTSLPALRTAAMVCDAQGDSACVCRFAAAVLQRAPQQKTARALAARHHCAK